MKNLDFNHVDPGVSFANVPPTPLPPLDSLTWIDYLDLTLVDGELDRAMRRLLKEAL